MVHSPMRSDNDFVDFDFPRLALPGRRKFRAPRDSWTSEIAPRRIHHADQERIPSPHRLKRTRLFEAQPMSPLVQSRTSADLPAGRDSGAVMAASGLVEWYGNASDCRPLGWYGLQCMRDQLDSNSGVSSRDRIGVGLAFIWRATMSFLHVTAMHSAGKALWVL